MSNKNDSEIIVRDWNEFSNTTKFSFPKDMDHWSGRLESNLVFYSYNYVYLSGVIMFCSSFSTPPLPLLELLLGALQMYSKHRDGIQIGDKSFSNKAVSIFTASSFIILGAYVGENFFLTGITVALSIVVAHASFHHRSIKAKMNNFFNQIFDGTNELIFEPLETELENQRSAQAQKEQNQKSLRRKNSMNRRHADIRKKYDLIDLTKNN